MRISNNIIGVCQVQKRDGERKECGKKKKEKRWKKINISKVVEVKFINLDLDLLWKDLGEIIRKYKMLLF